MDVTFFNTQSDLRAWFETNHDTAGELWIGFYKKGSGLTAVTYPEAVDMALCFGWIDGIRKSLDSTGYANRFTPRKRGSTWSLANIKRVGELTELGLMHPAGLKIFNSRDPAKSALYSFEQERVELGEPYLRQFIEDAPAYSFFLSQPPSYRKVAAHWVIGAKQEATRLRRLGSLIEHSARGERLPHLSPTPKRDP